jgi:hypothetical protein
MGKITMILLLIVVPLVPAVAVGGIISQTEFDAAQEIIKDYPSGDRIAFWAERFIGTPYDPDPLGEYVRKQTIVADNRVDCMYLTFRSVELAMSDTFAQTVDRALSKRFITRGKLDSAGRVMNYEDRYQYGIDMVRSGKFGTDVSKSIARTVSIEGSRDIEAVDIINKEESLKAVEKIKNGDIIFFIKDPSKRKVGEIVGHIGIAYRDKVDITLIHASGTKNGTGVVKKVALRRYLAEMPFIGMIVTRFD